MQDKPRIINETNYANNTNTITFTVVPSTEVTFVSEGNIIAMRRYGVGDPYGRFPDSPIRTGFRFVGWFTDEDGGDMVTATSVVSDSPTTLYAHWDVAIQQTVTVGGTLASGETKWMCGNLYKVTSNLTIPSGATLTLEPGVIVKFEAGKSMTVNSGGILKAIGTRALPIVFTSIKDDVNGGDTNGDEDATQPQAGDWARLLVRGNATMDYCSLLYGSLGSGTDDILTVDGGTVRFSNGKVMNIGKYAVGVESGHFYMNNSVIAEAYCAFRHCPSDPIINSVIYNCNRLSNNNGQKLYNCIIVGVNEAWDWSSGRGDTYKNCVFWNESGFGLQKLPGSATTANGNVWANPLFVDPENGDFHIAANSPCVDAGDGTVAPEKDYYGLERRDVGKVTNSGVPSANGNCPDIGIHEVLWDEDESPYDIAPIAVSIDKATAKIGDKVKISWTIQNLGTEDVVGGWHDAVSLVSSSGQSVELGEVLTTYTLKRKMSMNVNGTFMIPALPEGTWYARVNTNSRRSDVPEGLNTTNNVLSSTQGLAVSLAATPYADGASGTLSVGSSTVVKFTFPAGTTGQIARVSVPAGLSVSYGLGFMPQGAYASGTITATEKGEALFHVPAGTTEVYLVMDAAQSEGQNYSVSFVAGDLAISSVSPNTVPSSGLVSLAIRGAGFSNDLSVSLVNGSQTLSGIDVLGISPENIEAQIDCATLQPGATYDLLVAKGDVQVRVTAAITTLSESGSWNIVYDMETPDSVREQRVFSGWIVFENTGNVDAPLPIFILSSDDNNTQFMTSSRSAVWRTKLSLLGVSYAGQSSVKPGEKCRIPFYAKVTSARAGSISIAALDETRTVDYNEVCAMMNFDADDLVLMQKIRGLYGLNWSDFADSIRQFVIKYPDMVELDYDINALVNRYLTECEGKRVYGRLNTTTVVPNGIKMMLYNVSDECETPTVTAVSYCDAEGVFCFQNITNGCYCIRAESVNTEQCLVEMHESRGDVLVSLNEQPFGVVNTVLPLGIDTYSTNLVVAFENLLTHEQIECNVPCGACNTLVGNLYTGEYAVTLLGDGKALSTVDSTVVSNAETSLAFAPIDFVTISGMVVSKEGNPIDAIISVGNKNYAVNPVTGRFSFNVISNSYVLLCCSAEGYESHVERVEVLSESVSICMTRAVKVSGRALLDGIPVSPGSIIEFNNGQRSQFCVALEDGRYSIELASGSWVASYASMEGNINSVSVAVESSVMELDITFELDNSKSSKMMKSARSAQSNPDTATLRYYEEWGYTWADIFRNFYGLRMGFFEPAQLLDLYIGIPEHNLGKRIPPIHFDVNSKISQRAKTEYSGCECPYVVVWSIVKSHITKKIENKILNGCDQLLKPKDIKQHMSFNYKISSPLFPTFGGMKSTAYEYSAQKIAETDEEITYHVDVVTTATDVYEFDGHTDSLSVKMIVLEKAGWATRFNTSMDIKDEFICKIPKDKDPEPEKKKKRRKLKIPKSCDPNEMVGPEGTGEARYVQPGEWMNYTIYFENKTNATAAAQEVYVTNPFSEWLDWSTFEMGEVSFNNQIDIGLSGLHGGVSEVQMSGTNYAVRTVLGGGNDGEGTVVTSGVAHWYMRIVDNSDETTWPADPYAGFLPPNDPETHCGEGHLTYRIKVRDDAPRNVVITNSATIVFDYNAPIETDPSWWNTVGTFRDVSLEIDGVTTNLTLIAGEAFGELPTPKTARTGYTFDGWYTGENGTGIKATSDTIVPEGEFSLYQNWMANVYAVRFNANGGEGTMPDQAFVYGTPDTLSPNEFTRTYHDFTGWATNATGVLVYADGSVVTNLTAVDGGVVELFAAWERQKVSVVIGEGDDAVTAQLEVGLPYGDNMPTNPAVRTGWTFGGWFTGPNGTGRRVTAESLVEPGDSGLYAKWSANAYKVRFNANGGTGTMADQAFVYGTAQKLSSNAFTRKMYAFAGWARSADGAVEFADGQSVKNLATAADGVVTLYAVWTMARPMLWNEVTGDTYVSMASVYNGYLYDGDGNVKGTILVKVGKQNAKTKLSTVKATVTLSDGKSKNLKAIDKGKAVIAPEGTTDVPLTGGDSCTVTLGLFGMSGHYGSLYIDGSRDYFSSRSKSALSTASAMASKWAAVNVAWDDGTMTVTIDKKGKAKIVGNLSSGTKVSSKSQLIIGENWCCVPVIWAKKKEAVAVTLWLPISGDAAMVSGLDGDVNVGAPGVLNAGAEFHIDADELCGLLGDSKYAEYLPDGVSVEQKGSKWIVAGGAKAGKVQVGKDGKVDDVKAGANPSALKFTYRVKGGIFNGSFKAYMSMNGKPKALTVNVTGVLIDGTGYGTATIKRMGGVAVTIE